MRDAAVELDPALAQAFAAWDRATDLRPAHDGSVLLASFESPEEARFWKHPFGVSVSTSNAWATDGERCAELTYTGVGAWPRAIHYDPDWRFADWSRYRTLEFDVQNPGDALLELVMIAGDDESFGHAVVERWFQVPAGEEQHCVVPLTDLRAHHQWYQSVFFEGQARLDDIRTFQISAPRITAPTLVRLDNLRLVP